MIESDNAAGQLRRQAQAAAALLVEAGIDPVGPVEPLCAVNAGGSAYRFFTTPTTRTYSIGVRATF